jgi:hypothetical protein
MLVIAVKGAGADNLPALRYLMECRLGRAASHSSTAERTVVHPPASGGMGRERIEKLKCAL